MFPFAVRYVFLSSETKNGVFPRELETTDITTFDVYAYAYSFSYASNFDVRRMDGRLGYVWYGKRVSAVGTIGDRIYEYE